MSLDDLEMAAKALVPPGLNPSARLKYDLAVSISLGVIALSMVAHVAMACGFMSWLGISGFALASDVSTQQAQLTTIQLSQINRDIRDAKRQICLAQQTKNQAALTSWAMTLQSAKGQYFAVTKSWPDVQTCEELLVTGSN